MPTDTELVDDLEGVFAPVLEVDEGVVQRRAVVAGEGIDAAQGLGSGEDIGGNDFIEQAGKLGFGEADPVQGFEFLAEVLLQRGAVSDVRAVFVFKPRQFVEEALLDLLFNHCGLFSTFGHFKAFHFEVFPADVWCGRITWS